MRFKEFLTEKKSGQTAWVILYTPDKLLLGKRAPGVNNPNQWNFFGGHIDEGETPEQAAARELQEEIMVAVDPNRLVKVAEIGNATYFKYKVGGKVGQTTGEVSSLKLFKLTELPDNLHAKTQTFFDSLEHLLD